MLQTGSEEDSYLAASQNLPPALARQPHKMSGSCYCLDTFRQGDLEGAANVNVVTCSRLKNEAAVRGKDRLDLTIDPPPDLAIEIDITSRTHPNIYEALRVPELWRFEQNQLQINVLKNGHFLVIQIRTGTHDPIFISKSPSYQ